jgi:hypothetical protein
LTTQWRLVPYISPLQRRDAININRPAPPRASVSLIEVTVKMIQWKRGRPALPSLWLPACITLTVLLFLSTPSSTLRTVPGSPCESVCASNEFGTVEEDVVCLDEDYTSTKTGEDFQRCVSCGLNSTAVDRANNVSDVEYALFDLRYTLSTCMFAFPVERVSISSPCQVTCQPLSVAIGFGLSNNSANTSPGLGFCTAGQFDDTTINYCSFCYGFIPEQLYLANCRTQYASSTHNHPLIMPHSPSSSPYSLPPTTRPR